MGEYLCRPTSAVTAKRADHIEPILDYFKRAWIHWKVDALGFQSMVFSCWDDEVALCF